MLIRFAYPFPQPMSGGLIILGKDPTTANGIMSPRGEDNEQNRTFLLKPLMQLERVCKLVRKVWRVMKCQEEVVQEYQLVCLR